MLDHNDLLPDEQQDPQLVQQLRDMFDTHAADVQSLASIRQRLLVNGAGSLPARKEPIALHKERTRIAKEANMQFIQKHFYTGKTWQQRLGALVAVLLVGALVGSLLIVLTHLHQGQVGGHSSRGDVQHDVFHLPQGWSEIKRFSGTGSKSISTGLGLDNLWGASIVCKGRNGSNANVTFAEIHASVGSNCLNDFIGATTPAWPQMIRAQMDGFMIMQEIKVDVEPGIEWQLQIAQGPTITKILQPAASHPVYQSSGFGAQQMTMHVALPAEWVFDFNCSGNGEVKLDVPGVVVTGYTLKCNNGMPTGTRFRGTGQFTLTQIQITVDPQSFWQIVVVDCTHTPTSALC